MRTRVFTPILACLALLAPLACSGGDSKPEPATVSFEELVPGAEGFWNGSDSSGKFVSDRATFHNGYNADYQSWEGFAYSSKTDTTTPGFENQYSAIPGSGADGSTIYAVGQMGFGGAPPTVSFEEGAYPQSVRLTNTTYAYLSMKNGDAFAKKFGGADGTDPDWFKLTITGTSFAGTTTGTVEVYLADFRADGTVDDVLIDSWIEVDLSRLGEVSTLSFALSSSDNGEYGMNTPGYFALDNLVFEFPSG
jgi:hypothetical protein